MENEKLQINLAPGAEKAEILIREVKDANEIPVKPPVSVCITGVIGAPFEFLTRRLDQPDQINQKRCHILVNRIALTMILVINENDYYKKGQVTGVLELHPVFVKFGINTGYDWEPTKLGQFFKMNRAYFANKEENMKLVSILKNFNYQVNLNFDKEKQDNGSFKDNYVGLVTSKLPEPFKLHIPLFKGRPAEDFEVEFYAGVNGRDINLQLYSPSVSQTIEEVKDEIFDHQIAQIRDIAPHIAIIEV